MIEKINTLRSKNRLRGAPFDDPCRDNKDSELDSFLCVCVCCVCVSFLLSVFFCISLAIKIHAKARCVCGKKKVRARSVFPSSNDDDGG